MANDLWQGLQQVPERQPGLWEGLSADPVFAAAVARMIRARMVDPAGPNAQSGGVQPLSPQPMAQQAYGLNAPNNMPRYMMNPQQSPAQIPFSPNQPYSQDRGPGDTVPIMPWLR
jgi:hypothetical protein